MTIPIKTSSKEVLLYVVTESPVAHDVNHVKVGFLTAAELDQYWARVPNDAKRNVEQRNFPVFGTLVAPQAYAVVVWDAPFTQPEIDKKVLRVFGSSLDARAFAASIDLSGPNRSAAVEAVIFTLPPSEVGMHTASISNASMKDVRTWEWSAVRGGNFAGDLNASWTATGRNVTPEAASSDARDHK